MEMLVMLKRGSETCRLGETVLAELKQRLPLTLYSQDDTAFPEAAGGTLDDLALEQSWRHNMEIAPTLIRVEGGRGVARAEGWDRAQWVRVSGIADLGPALPPFKPGCGSKSVEPGMPERLALRFGDLRLSWRPIAVDAIDDPAEVAYSSAPVTGPSGERSCRRPLQSAPSHREGASMGQWSRKDHPEPFIELVPVAQAQGPRKALYDELERVRGKGRVSNLFKAYSAFPQLGMANFRRLMALLGEGALSVKFKEAVMTALAEINRCDYCVSFHATAMKNAGASESEVQAALRFDPRGIGLSAKEQALFEYALKANGDPHGIRPEDFVPLRAAGVTDGEIVEALETVNTGNAFNLINGALNVGADDYLGGYLKERGEAWAAER